MLTNPALQLRDKASHGLCHLSPASAAQDLTDTGAKKGLDTTKKTGRDSAQLGTGRQGVISVNTLLLKSLHLNKELTSFQQVRPEIKSISTKDGKPT